MIRRDTDARAVSTALDGLLDPSESAFVDAEAATCHEALLLGPAAATAFFYRVESSDGTSAAAGASLLPGQGIIAPMQGSLTERQILKALERLAGLLKERQIQGEVCFLGGAAMVLAFKARPSTKDVDAIFQPAQVIRDLAATVQREQGLPESWLNDAAKGYASARHDVAVGDLPQFESLRLTAPTAEYLLAMKCIASRIPGGPRDRGDVQDIQFLLGRLGLKSPEEAMAIVARYYPEERIPPRARFLIEDIFEEIGGTS